jgi:hypothetical protein
LVNDGEGEGDGDGDGDDEKVMLGEKDSTPYL